MFKKEGEVGVKFEEKVVVGVVEVECEVEVNEIVDVREKRVVEVWVGGELGSDVDEEVIGGGVDVNIVFFLPTSWKKSKCLLFHWKKSKCLLF